MTQFRNHPLLKQITEELEVTNDYLVTFSEEKQVCSTSNYTPYSTCVAPPPLAHYPGIK